MPATEEILLKLTGDPSGAKQALEQVGQGLDRVKQRAEHAKRGFQAVAVAAGALTAAGGVLIKSTSQVAMRNEVLAVSLYATGQNAGYTSQELDILTDRVKAMGITTSNARLSLTRMIQSQLDLGKATDLARTAQDLAVIAGENSSDTYGNITQAISALQPRLLRQYGIVATVDQILGDLSNSTDVAAKRNRFLNFVLEEGAKVAGVYESAMGVVGKQITSIPRLFEEARAALGEHFLPIIGKGVEMLSKFLKWFEALPPGVQKTLAHLVLFGTVLSGIIAAVSGVGLAVASMVASLGGVSAIVGAVTGALTTVAPVILAVVAAVGALTAAGYVLWTAWQENWGGIREAVESAWAKIQPLLAELMRLARQWGAVFQRQIGQIWAAVKGLLEPVFARISALIRSVDWSGLFANFKDAINVAGRYISALLQTIRGLLQGKGLAAFMPLHGAMVDVLTMIALTWQKYISKALTWGYNLVVQAANGIASAAQTVLVKVMQFIGSVIGRFLAPGSAPREGPLSHIVEWGKGVFATYLRAFGLADFGILRDVLSPLKSALQSALALGGIDESEFVNIYTTVREQVAGLIAYFRETGEISEEMLGKIAEALGEGSEEYVEYLRLTLEYQRALENLESIQEEYAEASERGFVSKELKDKLKAAEEEAETLEESVAWYEEYLAMQEESMDLQQELATLMEGLSDSMDKMADAAEKMGEGLGAGEAMGGLDLGDLASPETRGLLGDVTSQLGVMSDEFLEMRGRVEAGLAAFRVWLGLPIADKMSTLFGWLTDITGVDFTGFWQSILDLMAEIDAKGWAETLGKLFVRIALAGVGFLGSKAGEVIDGLVEWFGGLMAGLFDWVAEDHTNWARTIGQWIGAALGLLLQLLTVDIPRWVRELIVWLGDIITGLLDWFRNEAPRVGRKLWAHFKVALSTWLENMMANIPVWIGNLIAWAAEIIAGFVEGVLEHAPDWLHGLVDVGGAIVDALIEGLKEHWWRLVDYFRDLLKWLKDQLPGSEPKDRTSPLRGLAKSGAAIADNLARGIDLSSVRSALATELAGTQTALASSVGDMTVYQSFGDLSFPNVKTGRDAGSVRDGLDRRAYRAAMMGRTGGL